MNIFNDPPASRAVIGKKHKICEYLDITPAAFNRLIELGMPCYQINRATWFTHVDLLNDYFVNHLKDLLERAEI